MYNCIGGDDVDVDDEKHIACDTTAHICADENEIVMIYFFILQNKSFNLSFI